MFQRKSIFLTHEAFIVHITSRRRGLWYFLESLLCAAKRCETHRETSSIWALSHEFWLYSNGQIQSHNTYFSNWLVLHVVLPVFMSMPKSKWSRVLMQSSADCLILCFRFAMRLRFRVYIYMKISATGVLWKKKILCMPCFHEQLPRQTKFLNFRTVWVSSDIRKKSFCGSFCENGNT